MSKPPYPVPLTIPPLAEEHTHTLILLHGRGSNAERFGREFLASANLQPRLPTVKFVFPTARKRRSTVLKKIPINQWFDNYSLEDPGQRTDLQVEGLCETAEFLRGLIDNEASILGENGHHRVIFGGLSQGCAAAIFTLLGGNEAGEKRQAPGAFVGMSGWLPFEQQLRDILRCEPRIEDETEVESDHSNAEDGDSPSDQTDDEDSQDSSDDVTEDAFSDTDRDNDPFSRATTEDDGYDPFSDGDDAPLPVQALNHVRDILDLAPLSEEQSHRQIPVFLGHGSADPKVSVNLGREMVHLLSAGLGMDVTWKAYEGFGHWYKVPDEIDDILSFLQVKINLPVVATRESSD